jgi:hypothetical protein
MATAMPRRRTNHSEVSATSGAKVAELPSRPIRRPCQTAKLVTLPAEAAAAKPAPRPAAPTSTGTITPKRSARRPIRMPPRPKPSISSVYGSEASERATPNSACTAGSTTATTYMPLEPMVIRPSTAARRVQA